MVKLLGKLIGMIITIVMIPIILILAVPMGILKARRAQKSRLFFTGTEQTLLGKAQRAINMEENGLISPDRDLLEVAKCIENARCDYQIIKGRERFDSTFSEFVLPRIYNCHVVDWDNVNSFFELSTHPTLEETDRFIKEDVDDGMPYDDLYDETKEQEGKDDIVVIITQGVNSKISSEKVALQFVLEELDAARQGNEAAVQFVKNSDFSPSEYEGAMQNSFEEVDGPDGPQQFLLSSVTKFSSDMDSMVNLRLKVVEKIIHDWELNKQVKGRAGNLLQSLRKILEDDDRVMPALTNNIPVPASARTRHVHFRKKNIDSAQNIVSTLTVITGDNVDTVIKNALQITSLEGESVLDASHEEQQASQNQSPKFLNSKGQLVPVAGRPIEPDSRSLDGPEYSEKLGEFYSLLHELSERRSLKTCKMQVIPCDGSFWSWDFEFSDEEEAQTNEVIAELYDYAQGWIIAPTFPLSRSADQDEGDDDIPF